MPNMVRKCKFDRFSSILHHLDSPIPHNTQFYLLFSIVLLHLVDDQLRKTQIERITAEKKKKFHYSGVHIAQFP